MESQAQLMKAFKACLTERGLKSTRQREAIATVFFKSQEHLSLLQVLERAKGVQASIGYATVYRTMKLLVSCGLAHEHKFGEGTVLYECAQGEEHHDHLICVQCGLIVEYEDHEIERLQEELAKKLGFRVVGHRHELYGDCLRLNCPERTGLLEADEGGKGLAGNLSGH